MGNRRRNRVTNADYRADLWHVKERIAIPESGILEHSSLG